MKKYATLAGGAAIVAAMFLPFATVYGKTVTGMEMNSVAKLLIGIGLFIMAVGWSQQKRAYYFSAVAGLLVAALALKYYSDASQYGKAGIGIGLMLAGGIGAVVGSVAGLVRKKPAAQP